MTTAIKTTAIRAVTEDTKTHTIALKQLKETTELALRLRGDPLDSFVRVRELVDAGVVRLVDGNVVAANTALSTSPVPQSRRINTGTGLLGGGDLSADRTLTVDDSHWATVAFTGAYSDLTGTPAAADVFPHAFLLMGA